MVKVNQNLSKTKPLRLIGIVRVSTMGQAAEDKTGIPRQHQSIESTRKRVDGVWIKPPIELKDVSGADVLQTPEYQELISMMKRGEVDGVVVEEFTRLCRPGTYYDFIILQHFKDNGVILFTRDGFMDLNKDMDNMNAGFQALVAGNERNLIKRRLIAGKEKKRRDGELPDSKVTIPSFVSYDKATKKWSYNEFLPKVIKCIEIIEGGGTYRDCERAVGIKHETIAKMLRNRMLVGIREHTFKRGDIRYKSKNGRQSDRKKVPRKREEVITVKVIDPPAITEQRFGNLQNILDKRRQEWRTKRTKATDDWLNGILHCGVCGQKMYLFRGEWEKNKKKDRYFCRSQSHSFKDICPRCKNIRCDRDVVERDVLGFIEVNLCHPKYLESLVLDYIKADRNTERLKADIEKIKKTIQESQKERDRFLSLFGKGLLEENELSSRIGKINNQLKKDQALELELESKVKYLDQSFDEATIQNIVTTFKEFPFLPASDKNKVLMLCMPKIRYIGGQGVSGATISGVVNCEPIS